MSRKEKRKLVLVLCLCVLLAMLLFIWESVGGDSHTLVTRNSYGQGSRMEEYQLTIPGEVEDEALQIEIQERQYTPEETKEVFELAMKELDRVVLGENENFNRVEKNLRFPTQLQDYPIQIQWELDSYEIMNIQGEIQEKNIREEGNLLGIRGILTYGEEQAVYVRSAMIYPLTRTGADKLLYEVKQAVIKAEESSREAATFSLPEELNGMRLEWSQKKAGRWCYVLLIAVVYGFYQVYRSREKRKQEEKIRREELLREYPHMISKFAMLLGTGTTVKQVWDKIVQDYEKQKTGEGGQLVYEEMGVALREMNSGISEVEAYERFGKRCGVLEYIKFGALLTQNLRKGSRGMSDVLRMEVVRSFEERKRTAKRLGEEAGTKLLLPMLGMLGVVMIMVMVPAFLSMGF